MTAAWTSLKVGYVIVDASGDVRLALYRSAGAAKAKATQPGDSVVAVEIDLTKEPVFIRQRAL